MNKQVDQIMEDDRESVPNKGKDIASTSCVSNIKPNTGMTGDILTQLQNKMGSLTSQQDRAEWCCIYRVPNSFRKVRPEAYTPKLISIGPLHRGDERLKDMEEQKLRYFKGFSERNGMDKKKIEDLLIIIQDKEPCIRASYSENFSEITSSEFIEMILLDAVFIIEFLGDSNDSEHYSESVKPWMIFDIREDLMLLENQLPFFIIKEIYEKGFSKQATCFPFLDLANVYLGKYTCSQGLQNTDRDVEGSRHFTDLLRNFMLNGAIQRSNSFNPIKLKYNAVMLREAGVKFQVTEDKCLVNITFEERVKFQVTEDKCLVNVTFEEGVLKIPRLEVDYCFERLVRNIMALEQCCYPFEAYVCSYIKFMDHLIDSAEDVALLAENGIILNWLGDDAAVSNMINKLCETITDTYTFYDDICKKMNAHYKNRWNHRKATLKLVYFPNVWRGTATVAAAILLILTLIQTITSVKSVF
ncbi:hypothetical protein H0E87_028908 [Populus deltoides]|uniref:Uncharacterized protein n=1 Tax=Populus deltoides TaxID=3696 RepID=A0A8T2WXF2_POPDE|nr:hypothetical protein H0E87_028908 [Populus deltoides]